MEVSTCLTMPIMERLWPHGDQHIPGLREGMIKAAPAVFAKYAVPSVLAVALMMGQFSEECGCGLEMVENGNYSARGLLRTFPTHFTSSMARRYAHSAQAIFDIAYGGRMGNAPPPSHDGSSFCGRGLSQLTGRTNYDLLSRALGTDPKAYPQLLRDQHDLPKSEFDANYPIFLDLTENPSLINDPDHVLECGVADFILCGCMPYAAEGDILNTTKRLNGGTNGLAERRAQTHAWRRALGV